MNCIVLLLLLSCCGGWGNGGGCTGNCGCGNRHDHTDCRRPGHNHGCRPMPCDCHEKERPCCEPCDDGCRKQKPCCGPEPDRCAKEERECGCDSPSSGMIPPPWQDYPKFPRRDEDCGCEQ